MDWQIRNRVMAAIRAFQEPQIVMNLDDLAEFDDFDSRIMRYNILWAFYENTAYNNVHKWSTQYRVSQGLYRYIRNIGNPSNRLGNFHQTHIWGGLLDPAAGDGKNEPSALPIITDNEDLRPIISQIWQWSNWQIKKDLATLYGAVMGDSAIRIVDKLEDKRVYLEVIHPKLLKEVIKDDFGNVKAYSLEEERPDPRRPNHKVTYTEIAARGDNGEVIFQTYLDGSLYAWNGEVAEWQENYGFIPFVHIPHIDVGSLYGWSDLHAGRGKFQEIDDLWSKVDDYIRKITEGLFLFKGVKQPTSTSGRTTTQTGSSRDKPMPGREDVPGLWTTNESADAIPLIHQANIADMLADIEAIRKEIERDYPELMIDESAEVTAESGRAKRIKQEKPASKIEARRPTYDDALVRSQQMAMSIGALRDYPGFESITPDSFERGDLDHNIGQRPVFKVDKLDELEEANLFLQNVALATSVGMDLSAYLESEGWTKEQIRAMKRGSARTESMAARRAARQPVEVQAVNEETSGDIVEEAEA